LLTYRELRILRAADAAERERSGRIARIRALAFDKQLAVMDDPSPLISILCTRRSGKSMTVGLDTCESMEENPGASHLIVGLTRESIKRIYWKDVLHHINDAAALGYEFNRSELSMRAPNGAVCYFVGVDTSEDEKRKILGQKFAKAWADEAGEYKIDLADLVYQTLKPAVSDYRGQIGLAGTPGEFLGSVEDPQLFYAVTRDGYDSATDPQHGGWSTHRWSAFDNPHQAAIHAEQLDEIEKQRPEFKNTTKYLTHYLGKWPSVSDKLVYKFDAARNTIDAAPTCTSFVVACDLGFNDATSFVVLGWCAHDPNLYILSATKKTEMDFDEVATEIKRLRATYANARLVIDGANKQGVEHMRRVYSLPLEAAEKHAKYDYVRMMNTDLQMKRVRVVKSECSALTSEWLSLEWDRRSRVPKEDEGVDNHCADAALYGWRLARHYLAEPEKPSKPSRNSEEAFEADILRRARPPQRKRGLL
jgi:hypothetical protein